MRYQEGLRVCVTAVTLPGQGEKQYTAQRIEAAVGAIAESAQFATELMVLPAGYLRAAAEKEVHKVGQPIIDAARRASLAVIFGVDTEPMRYPDDERVERGKLPCFLVGWSPQDRQVQVWRQRSMSSRDWKLAPLPERDHIRELRVADREVAPLACGE